MGPHVLPKLNDRVIEAEILRMLWTLHFVSMKQLCRLMYGKVSRRRLKRLSNTLDLMYSRGWVWREPWRMIPGYEGHMHGFNSGGWFYGLMEEGRKHVIDELEILELRTIHCMTREAYFSGASRRSIVHSTHYTEYLTRFIEETRRSPFTMGIYIDTECTLLGRHLRMDGLLRYRRYRQEPPRVMERQAQLATLPPWHVPWQYSLRLPASAEVLDRTYAIEIDESTEQLSIIQRKAENYKRTFLGGMELVETRVVRYTRQLPGTLCCARMGTICYQTCASSIFPFPCLLLVASHASVPYGSRGNEVGPRARSA